jgi:acyl-CoA synthetase (AMP-forming)/AMP-acid ligase II
VLTPDGYIRIKDRSKDIIISGGENISSIEVEDALYRHPAVLPRRWSRARSEVGRGAVRVRRAAKG